MKKTEHPYLDTECTMIEVWCICNWYIMDVRDEN